MSKTHTAIPDLIKIMGTYSDQHGAQGRVYPYVYVGRKQADEWFSRYARGLEKPNYPVPAIPLAVKYDYVGCVNIDDVTNPDDPIIVWMYDSWDEVNC